MIDLEHAKRARPRWLAVRKRVEAGAKDYELSNTSTHRFGKPILGVATADEDVGAQRASTRRFVRRAARGELVDRLRSEQPSDRFVDENLGVAVEELVCGTQQRDPERCLAGAAFLLLGQKNTGSRYAPKTSSSAARIS
jgi:hypothetical protein